MVGRSTVAVSLVVLVVLLSGCSAILGGNGNGNGVGDGNGGNGATDPSTFEYADGYGPDGVIDGEAAVESHQSGVVDRGSYTGSYTYEIATAEGTTLVDVENRVDFQGEEGFQRADVSYPNQEGVVDVYRDSETRYRRTAFNNQTSIQTANESFDPPNLTATDPIRPLLGNVSRYDAEIERRDGVEVVVYERTDAGGIDQFLDVNESATINSFNATLAVDGDGVVRSARYEVDFQRSDGEKRSLTVEYELSAFGETTVDRPAWVDSA
jgi:hypothetical protein